MIDGLAEKGLLAVVEGNEKKAPQGGDGRISGLPRPTNAGESGGGAQELSGLHGDFLRPGFQELDIALDRGLFAAALFGDLPLIALEPTLIFLLLVSKAPALCLAAAVAEQPLSVGAQPLLHVFVARGKGDRDPERAHLLHQAFIHRGRVLAGGRIRRGRRQVAERLGSAAAFMVSDVSLQTGLLGAKGE